MPALVFAVLALFAPLFAGDPRPAKADVLYLLQAGNLIETEQQTAGEQHKGSGKKEEITYSVSGAASPVHTPLASPIFLLLTSQIDPDTLSLFRIDVRNGRREMVVSSKKKSKPLSLSITKMDGGVARIEVVESLVAGEYVITPNGSNQVFAFSVE